MKTRICLKPLLLALVLLTAPGTLFANTNGLVASWHFDEGKGRAATEVASGKRDQFGAASFGIYPMDLWHRIFNDYDVDAALVHNHYCLHDTRVLELLPVAETKGMGIINGSPFGSGLLTDRGPADWHPATIAERAAFAKATAFCREQGTSISQLALQFSSQHPEIPTTLFSSARPESVRRNVRWHEETLDASLLAQVRKILVPVLDRQWDFDAALPVADSSKRTSPATRLPVGGLIPVQPPPARGSAPSMT